MRLVVATGNKGKLAEIEDVLAGLGIELVAQSALGIPEAEETGATFVENALIKARSACERSGLPALADDSGLCVDALEGAPGLISAHYGGVHGDAQRNIKRLLRERPQVVGIAAPGMPMGSPGMETPGRAAAPYDVVSFDAAGNTRVFAPHR